jgi:hypothetical protein
MPNVNLGHASGESTFVAIPEGQPLQVMVRTITHEDGVWPAHTTGGDPVWVESDTTELAQALSEHYGCPIGRPEGSEVTP